MVKKNHESDVNFVKELAKLLREHNLNELEVDRNYGDNDNFTVRIARQNLGNVQSEASIAQQSKA